MLENKKGGYNMKLIIYTNYAIEGTCGRHTLELRATYYRINSDRNELYIYVKNKGYYTLSRIMSAEGAAAARKTMAQRSDCGNYGATIGIIGAGMIGKMVIGKLRAYNLKVVVFDPFLSDEKAEELGGLVSGEHGIGYAKKEYLKFHRE